MPLFAFVIRRAATSKEALIKTKMHILPKGNMQKIYRQKSPALP